MTDTKLVSKPSPLQLALALAIKQCAPPNMTIRDFICNIRRHIQNGPQARYSVMDQHIDPVSLLKTEHEKAEERNTSLQCRIIELENQLQSNVQSSRLKTPTMNGPSSSTKRKRDGPMELRQNARASKKQRSGSDFRNGVVMIDVFGIPKLDSTLFLPFGPAGQSFLRNLFLSHELSQRPIANEKDICFHTVQATISMSTLLSTIVDSSLDRNIASSDSNLVLPGWLKSCTDTVTGISMTFLALSRGFSMILLALQRVSTSKIGLVLSSNIVYALVTMFRQILQGLERVSKARAGNDITSGKSDTSQRSGKPKARAGKTTRVDLCQLLTQLLNGMISSLEPAKEYHGELFEGFSHVVMERIGSRLYLCTFERVRASTVEADILVEERSFSVSNLESKKGKVALHSELPCLISVLERVLALSPSFLDQKPPNITKVPKAMAPNTKSKASIVRSQTLSNKDRLSRFSKDRLQRTLVHCMFGSSNDDEAMDFLKLPCSPKTTLPIPPASRDVDSQVWFRNEIWRLIGWSILGGECDG